MGVRACGLQLGEHRLWDCLADVSAIRKITLNGVKQCLQTTLGGSVTNVH